MTDMLAPPDPRGERAEALLSAMQWIVDNAYTASIGTVRGVARDAVKADARILAALEPSPAALADPRVAALYKATKGADT